MLFSRQQSPIGLVRERPRPRSSWWLCAALFVGLAAGQAEAQLTRLPSAPEVDPLAESLPLYENVPSAPLDEDLECCDCDDLQYALRILPKGLIYRSYLAGVKESRFRSVWNEDQYGGSIWDITLGGRVGILRYGTGGDVRPAGWQIDVEGAGLVRLDIDESKDVDAADFRFGVPITYGTAEQQVKFAYYHLSSHVGDEYLIKHMGFPRLNFSRDVVVLGYSYYVTPQWRLYGEAGYAVRNDVSEPWEFQFGVEYSPAYATGLRGAPFFAVNGFLRQELDYGGNFVAQTGWAWRGSPSSGLFRVGVEYYNGHDDQFSFYQYVQNKVGVALWYDY